MKTSAHLAFNQLTTITHITQLYWERAGFFKFLFSFFCYFILLAIESYYTYRQKICQRNTSAFFRMAVNFLLKQNAIVLFNYKYYNYY